MAIKIKESSLDESSLSNIFKSGADLKSLKSLVAASGLPRGGDIL